MTPALKKILTSNQMRLNILGVFLLGLLCVIARAVARPLTWNAVVPLVCIVYAAFRVVFELTLNRANVPTLATSLTARPRITKLLQEEAARRLGQPYTVVDLGSGRGGLARHIAKAIPHARVIGIELACIPFWQAALIQCWFGPKNLSYQRRDFWPFDCSEVDAVVLYLMPTVTVRAGEKLHRELKPGSLVISHMFPLLGECTPIEVLQFRTPFMETIYVYRKK